jgi:hypothetical protein
LDLPIVHKLGVIYKAVYLTGPKLAKRDRYGIYLKIESVCLDALTFSIEAALLSRQRKTMSLEMLKIKIELLKQLVRIAHEIHVIEQKRYIALSADLIEASKMVSGWLKYINANSA